MVNIGKAFRLGQIFNRDSGRAVIVAMDHAPVMGPIPGLEKPAETVKAIVEGKPDAIFMHSGVLKKVFPFLVESGVPFLLKLTTTTTIGPVSDKTTLIASVEDAVTMGASGVIMRTFIGPRYEAEMIRDLGTIASECERYGMPLVAMIYPRGVENVYEVGLVKHVVRLAAELGADVVKTDYTGDPETFAEVVNCCPVPVVTAGGPKTETTEAFLELVKGAIKAGASGVAVGRNIWQHEKPAKMVEAIKRLVHEGASVQEAMEAFG